MSLRPLFNQVVVRPLPPDSLSAGGLEIPEVARAKQQQLGVVIAAGEGYKYRYRTNSSSVDDSIERRVLRELQPLDVREGDTVVYSRYAGEEHDLEGMGRVRILPEDHIMAIIER